MEWGRPAVCTPPHPGDTLDVTLIVSLGHHESWLPPEDRSAPLYPEGTWQACSGEQVGLNGRGEQSGPWAQRQEREDNRCPRQRGSYRLPGARPSRVQEGPGPP